MEAIIVTTAGGLAMLGGISFLVNSPVVPYSLTELFPGQCGSAPLLEGARASVGTGYVQPPLFSRLGALSKSAIFPFHFWLPAAMAAPTPTSAYLHAAAMVKAGVYLSSRMAPGFADQTVWMWVILPAAFSLDDHQRLSGTPPRTTRS